MQSQAAGDGILARLRALSSAEDFFTLLGVDYEPRIVNVSRLHILRRMGEYLAKEDFGGLDDSAIAERCKKMLEQAYGDFVASSPLDQRVFKVLKEAVAPKQSGTFVPLDSLFK